MMSTVTVELRVMSQIVVTAIDVYKRQCFVVISLVEGKNSCTYVRAHITSWIAVIVFSLMVT